MNMTPSLIRCLLAVLALSENYPHVASKDVAHLLGVKKPTVHHTLETLRGRELIDKELWRIRMRRIILIIACWPFAA